MNYPNVISLKFLILLGYQRQHYKKYPRIEREAELWIIVLNNKTKSDLNEWGRVNLKKALPRFSTFEQKLGNWNSKIKI